MEYYIRIEKAKKFLSHNHLLKPFKIILNVFDTRFCKISQTIPKMTTSKQMSLSLQKVVIFRMAELFPVNVSSWYLAMHIRYTFLCQLYFIHVNSLLWCHVARAVFDQRGNEWRITNPKVCYLVPDQISQNMLSMSIFHKKVMTFIGDINLIQV